MDAIYHLVYGSHAAAPFSKEQLVALLEKSQRNNQARGISGLLLYRDGIFLQVLEGPEVSVRALFGRICEDPRHQGIEMLMQGHSPRRQFPAWSMAFRDLEDPLLLRNLGYSEFMNQSPGSDRAAPRSTDLFALLERFRAQA